MALAWFGIRRLDDKQKLLVQRITGPRDWPGDVCYIDDSIFHDDKGVLKTGVTSATVPAEWAKWPGGKAPQNLFAFYVDYP